MARGLRVAGGARRFHVYLTALDPIQGSEIAKTRPCVIVSPDEINQAVRTVIIVPLTSTRERYAFRVRSTFGGREGDLALDQLRTVDKSRLVRWLGELDPNTSQALSAKLIEMFQV